MKASLPRLQSSHRLTEIPVVYLSAHTGCDCRCLMCDIWKADEGGVEMPSEVMGAQLASLTALKVRAAVLSGGEPLRHSNLWTFCRLLRGAGIKVVLTSNGTVLEAAAQDVVKNCDQLVVSLDGNPSVHDRIRQISGCAARLAAGVKAVLALSPGFPITARSVIQKHNCAELHNIVRYGAQLGLRAISFVAADVSSKAFNRPEGWDEPKIAQVALSHSDLCKLSSSIESLLTDFAREFERRFIRTTPGQLWDIFRYYKALLGQCDFPAVRCRAPWMSAVVEADGSVRPCPFHPPYGSIHEAPLHDVINRPAAVRFRRELRVTKNETCRSCVCATSRIAAEWILDV